MAGSAFEGAQRAFGILGVVAGTLLLAAVGLGVFENPIGLMVTSLSGIAMLAVGGLVLARSFLDL
jgi:hypothetical protein